MWIVLPQYNQAESTYWIDPDVTKFYLPYVQYGLLKKNDQKLSLFSPNTGSYLFLKGADNPDSLRGSGLDKIIFDEASQIKPSAFNILSPTLADSPRHSVLYISTPNGFDHFHDLCLLGDHNNIIEKGGKTIQPLKDYQTFKFTSYDNTSWPEGSFERKAFVDYINAEREKYAALGMSDWFEQEYMGEFRKRAGSVYPMFSRDVHIIPDMQLPSEWRRVRGWDFGSTDATASIRIAIDPDKNFYIERCYKQRKSRISDHAEIVKGQDVDISPAHAIGGYGDPSGAQWMTELTALNCPVIPAHKETSTTSQSWVQFGVGKIAGKLSAQKDHTVYFPGSGKREHAPSFFILNRPENFDLVEEFESQVYKKNNQGLSKAEIDDAGDPKGHFDLLAALRYATVSVDSSFTFMPMVTAAPVTPLSVQPPNYSEEERKKLELEADLQIMRAEQQRAMWGQ